MPAWPTHLTLQPTDARTEVQSGHNYFLTAPCIQRMWELEEKQDVKCADPETLL